eukprot:gnl/Trimastix_PCT/3015.p2 GENE.gnl/Trimastix_PCT/3015~~gnl/Trimastix_PCT/3015.p2  ORF type:complete len:281 (+),score=59.71 gnl/Trimastix_PCT/3015:98-940(+)
MSRVAHPLLDPWDNYKVLISGQFDVTVRSATDIPIADSNGLSDPYLVLTMGTVQHRTKVIKETLNPVWNEHFSFPYQYNTPRLVIHLYDQDALVDDFLGQMELEVTYAVFKKARRAQFQFYVDTEKLPATIDIILNFKPTDMGAEMPDFSQDGLEQPTVEDMQVPPWGHRATPCRSLSMPKRKVYCNVCRKMVGNRTAHFERKHPDRVAPVVRTIEEIRLQLLRERLPASERPPSPDVGGLIPQTSHMLVPEDTPSKEATPAAAEHGAAENDAEDDFDDL